MAVVTINTDLLPGPFFVNTPKAGGVRRSFRFKHTVLADADIGSIVRLCKMPQNGVLLPQDSYIRVLTATTSLTLALGYEAYTKPDKTIVPAATAGLGAATSVAAGTYVLFSGFGSMPLDFAFEGDAVVTALVGGAAMTAAKVLDGNITFLYPF